jgi:hypothetical protein
MMNLFLFKKQICFLYINLIQIIKTYEKQSNSKRKKNLFLDLRGYIIVLKIFYINFAKGKIGGT